MWFIKKIWFPHKYEDLVINLYFIKRLNTCCYAVILENVWHQKINNFPIQKNVFYRITVGDKCRQSQLKWKLLGANSVYHLTVIINVKFNLGIFDLDFGNISFTMKKILHRQCISIISRWGEYYRSRTGILRGVIRSRRHRTFPFVETIK